MNIWEMRAAALRAASSVFEGRGSTDTLKTADRARDEVLRMADAFTAWLRRPADADTDGGDN